MHHLLGRRPDANWPGADVPVAMATCVPSPSNTSAAPRINSGVRGDLKFQLRLIKNGFHLISIISISRLGCCVRRPNLLFFATDVNVAHNKINKLVK